MGTTLYQRLGESAGIARLVDDVIAAHLVNPLVKTRFENQDLTRLRKMAAEFFCAGAGGRRPIPARTCSRRTKA